MKKIHLLVLTSFFLVSIFTSCEKTLSEPDALIENVPEWSFSQLSSAEAREVLDIAFKKYREIKAKSDPDFLLNEKAGAQFIPPFFASHSFWIPRDLVFGPFGFESGIIAGFETDLDGNDFYRKNPDGTVSVKISSNQATGTHFNFGTFEEYTGENGKMTMKYDGSIVEVELPFPPFFIRFIDSNNNRSAVVWQGSAKVQLNGAGPVKQLNAHFSVKPGGESAKSRVSLR